MLLLIVIGCVALAFAGYVLWEVGQFLKEFNQTFDLLTAQYGWNSWLAKALALALAAPPVIFLRKSFLSFSKDKRKWRVAATVWGIAYCLGMFVVSREASFSHREGGVMQWYAVTPEGVRFFDSPGFDPKYGMELKPVTQQLKVALARRQLRQIPKRLPLNIRVESTFFDPLTGEARCWYYLAPDGHYDLFDASGFHPENGEPLREMTREEAVKVKDWLAKERSQAGSTTSPAVVKRPKEAIRQQTIPERADLVSKTTSQPDSGAPAVGTGAVVADRPRQEFDAVRPQEPLATARTASAGDFIFELKGCRFATDAIMCEFMVTNTGRDRKLRLRGWNDDPSRIIDKNGRKYLAAERRRVGSQASEAPEANLVTGVPVPGVLRFEKVTDSPGKLALLEIACWPHKPTVGMAEPLTVQFRDVPVVQ